MFLRDWRSAIIVLLNIPLALMAAVVALWLTGQTINLMTLGGLALAIGILVDEATVEIENIHTPDGPRPVDCQGGARWATRETAIPRLLAMVCILAVFISSFFMQGAPRAMFVPLSLAVGVLDGGLVSAVEHAGPRALGLAAAPRAPAAGQRGRHLCAQHAGVGRSGKRCLSPFPGWAWFPSTAFATATSGCWRRIVRFPLGPGGRVSGRVAGDHRVVGSRLGTEIFPTIDTGQFRLRMRAPDGTDIDRTEQIALKALEVIKADRRSATTCR